MSILIHCDSCHLQRSVNDRLAGRRVRCPECEQPIRVPKASEKLPSSPDNSDDQTGAEPSSEPDDQPISTPPSDSPALDESISPPASLDDDAMVTPSAEAKPVLAAAEPSSNWTADPSPRTAAIATGVSATMTEILSDDDDDDEDDQVLVRSKKPEEEMDMTPMVDVTFLLLIFFMVTAAFSLQKSIQMPRQQTEAPSSTVQETEDDESEIVEVEVDEFGSFLVLAPEWERETPGKQNLIAALREAAAGASDAMTLKVKVHEMAKIKALVDVMDAGTIASYSPIEVTQVDQFE